VELKTGDKLRRVPLRSIRTPNSNLGRAAYGEVLTLTWGTTEGRNFYVNIERAVCET
jgi:hypothetical protein